ILLERGADGDVIVRIASIDDFHPDQLYDALPLFKSLRTMRARLADPATFASAARELAASDLTGETGQSAAPSPPGPAPGHVLDAILGEPAPAAEPSEDALQQLIRRAIEPYLVAAADPRQDALLARVDRAMTNAMRGVLHTRALPGRRSRVAVRVDAHAAPRDRRASRDPAARRVGRGARCGSRAGRAAGGERSLAHHRGRIRRAARRAAMVAPRRRVHLRMGRRRSRRAVPVRHDRSARRRAGGRRRGAAPRRYAGVRCSERCIGLVGQPHRRMGGAARVARGGVHRARGAAIPGASALLRRRRGVRPVRVRGVRRDVRSPRVSLGQRGVRGRRAARPIVFRRRMAHAPGLAARAHGTALRAPAPERRGAGQTLRRGAPNGARVQQAARLRHHAAGIAQGSGRGAARAPAVDCPPGHGARRPVAGGPTMTATALPPSPTPSVCTGDPAAMRVLREFLAGASFTEESVSRRTGVESIYAFTSIREGRASSEPGDAMDILIRLFLDGELVERAHIEHHLPGNVVRALESLGLLSGPPSDASKQFATVLLYPTNGLWLISDLPVTAAGAPKPLPPDAVYPAITENTRDFISSLPRTPCERFLEMCGGTGIAALMAARHGGATWTGDVTERATRYARFNADLNGLGNVRAVQGDMYEPVRGLTFDRIVAHPPYIASPEQTMIYRDGGPDGEQFTRALLAGLPEFLEPGGRFYMTCVATDRTEGPFEQRIRRMIGPSNDEFDVVLAVRVARDPADYFRAVARAGQSSQEDADAKIAAYQAMGAEKLVYASMAIERHASPRTPFTARRSCGTTQLGESLDWELDWVRNRESPGFAARLLDSRVRCRDGVRIRSDQRLADGGWRIERVELSVEAPFRTNVECSAETGAILTRCTE